LTIDLEETLQRAEILFHQFKQRLEAVDNKRTALKKDIQDHPGWSDAERRVHKKEELEKLPRINIMLRGLLNNATTSIVEPLDQSTPRSRSSSVFSDEGKSKDEDSFVQLEKPSS
jgi:hypothetical protein